MTAEEFLDQAHQIGLNIQKDIPFKFTTVVEQLENSGYEDTEREFELPVDKICKEMTFTT